MPDLRPEDGTILASAIAQIKAEKPQSFTVSGLTDGHHAEGSLTYDRRWSNGWGATAYLKGWWHDATVTPGPPVGVVVGGEIVKKF